ncbi:hypothetical protein JYT86_00690 [bacterium AH-315-N03]|nr:hypothetical protein [bacterium AH-315-N03]
MSEHIDESFARLIERHVRDFLRSSVTCCAFARAHAKEASNALLYLVLTGRPDDESIRQIESFLDGAGDQKSAAVIVLPKSRAERQIIQLLTLLSDRPRWRVDRVHWKPKRARDDVLIGLWWETTSGDRTSVMGLAPLGSMPATRRAPYLALIAWTGGRENAHWKKGSDGEVGLVDMPLPAGMDEEQYRAAFSSTLGEAKRLYAALREGAARPDVAFCLASEWEAELAAVWT